MLHFSRASILCVWGLVILTGLMALPNVLPESFLKVLPSFIRANPLNLGLDLRGGSLMLLEVDTTPIVAEHLDDLRERVRGVMREEEIPISTLLLEQSKAGLLLTLVRGQDVEAGLRSLQKLSEQTGIFGTQQTLTIHVAGKGTLGEGSASLNDAGAKIFIGYSESQQKQWLALAVSQSIEVIRRRVDEFGTTEPSIQKRGRHRILLQVPGLHNPERLKALLGKTARLSIHLLRESPDGRRPPGTIALYNAEDQEKTTPVFVDRRPVVTGDEISSARTSFETGEPAVAFRLDPSGAKKFGRATQNHLGQQLAIVIDDVIISAPVVRQPILDGNGQISGGFSTQEASDLSITLRAGALPTPLHILEERTVGPSLGRASIDAGWRASIAALIVVIAFVCLVYGLLGIFASVALLFNLLMLVGVLSFIGATLTLPGIAGIVLTIGMAVDANIIIFERIREEYQVGRRIISAIDAGYRRAFWTVYDANLTTLLGAGVLYFFGTGLVRGFSVTLGIGVLTSLFTAFFVTRMIVAGWVRYMPPRELPL